MPIYEYRCETCGHQFEKLTTLSAPPPECPECGADTRKLLSATSFVLKGSGWYRDGYGLKKSGSSSTSESSAAKSTDSSASAA